jgi:pimeloyl-ACP methyl ester carboxylesterase
VILRVAGAPDPHPWPIDRIIVISGGGAVPMNAHRETLLSYDGTREHMKRILQVLFYSPAWWAEPIIDDWHLSSLVPGAWECAAAARLVLPGQDRPWRPETSDPARIANPTLVIGGADDYLREPGYATDLAQALPHGLSHIFAEARHFSHIEHARRFNELALDHLIGSTDASIRNSPNREERACPARR